MGRHFFPAEARTPADRLREILDEAEVLVSNLRSAGVRAMDLLRLLDQASETLEELEATGVDVRPERSRFETVQRKLARYKGRFLSKVGVEFREERASVQPDRERWWWFIDEALARERWRRLRRVSIWGAVAVVVLIAAGLLYEFVLAPPREVREAHGHRFAGEQLVMEEDLETALVEFEAAVALTSDDSESWVWVGVLRSELGEPGVEPAFETARDLWGSELIFLLTRGRAYRTLGDLDAASADVEQAILDYPDSGEAYYERSFILAEWGDYDAALDDLETAAELAHEAGNLQLEAIVRYQMAILLLQRPLPGELTPTP